jgi:hypothetical protein
MVKYKRLSLNIDLPLIVRQAISENSIQKPQRHKGTKKTEIP